MKSGILIAVILWLLQIAIVGTLVSEHWVSAAIARERALVSAWMGAHTAARIGAAAAGQYERLFLRTGIAQVSYEFLLPSAEQTAQAAPFHTAGNLLFPFIEARLNVLWSMVYQILARLALLSAWAPFLLVALVPAIVQGGLRRKIRQTTFAHASTLKHRYALYFALCVLYLLFIGLFLPYPVSPVLYPLTAVLLAGAAEVFVANTQKRL